MMPLGQVHRASGIVSDYRGHTGWIAEDFSRVSHAQAPIPRFPPKIGHGVGDGLLFVDWRACARVGTIAAQQDGGEQESKAATGVLAPEWLLYGEASRRC